MSNNCIAADGENESWHAAHKTVPWNNCSEGDNIMYDTILGIHVAVPPLEALLTAIVLAIVIATTIIGNIMVILSVFNYRPLRIAQNFFIVSLAVADLTVAILVLPFSVANYLLGKWIFGIYVCKMWLTSDVLCCTASILNLCAIALDRYWAITDPINYACKRTVKRVTIMIAITWVLSAIISSPPLIGWNNWPDVFDVNTPCQLTSEPGYVIYSSSGSFYIPLFIMTAVYVKIFIATRRRLRERARASKLSAVKGILSNKGEEHIQHSPMEQESMSSELTTNCVSNNSFRLKTKSKKSKKRCKHKTKCSQHSLLVPKTQPDESFSDVPSISPGKGTSSEGTDVAVTVDSKDSIIGIGTENAFSARESCSVQVDTLHIIEQPQLTKGPIVCFSPSTKDYKDGEPLPPPPAPPMPPPPPPKKSVFVHQFVEERQRISLSKERKAARTLGIIMGVFVVCWLPFFLMYVIEPFCSSSWCHVSTRLATFITWMGYMNSALNPIIYTIFNIDFRKAFKKILHMRP